MLKIVVNNGTYIPSNVYDLPKWVSSWHKVTAFNCPNGPDILSFKSFLQVKRLSIEIIIPAIIRSNHD